MCITVIARQRAKNLLVRYIAIQTAENNTQCPFIENSAHLVTGWWKTHIQHRCIDVGTRQCTVDTGQCTVDLEVTARFYHHIYCRQFQICQHNLQY